MNNIKEADFYQSFPPVLKRDDEMAALGRLIAEELHITANEAEKNIIYANIDNLAERWLDVIAYDLHIDWYNYDYPVEAKREVIKDSIRIHQKLGTKKSMEMALGALHPKSRIVEWFEYGGMPYHFKVILDFSSSKVEVDLEDINRVINTYKRLTTHIDGIYFDFTVRAAVRSLAVTRVRTKIKIRVGQQ